ncbi:zinc ABC transporter substrate-binding protein, partial [Klebsiella pneumoniae]|uniref:metal ABC transporter solute-binding protein, Zn/Mn family n=1 Tax=Klebsiella pneumoniae TaxID=573 RepID=UPI003A83AD2F
RMSSFPPVPEQMALLTRGVVDRVARAALEQRLEQLDAPNAAYYKARYDQFSARWSAAIAKWQQEAAPLKGAHVVVQHKGFTYLESWLGLVEVAALEPKPGMEPTTSHLA